MLKQSRNHDSAFTLLEILISIIIFSLVGVTLFRVTDTVGDTFDRGMSYATSSQSARDGGGEVAEKIRNTAKQLYPNVTTSMASYSVFLYHYSGTASCTARLFLETATGTRQLVLAQCQAAFPYAEVTAAPLFTRLVLITGIESFQIQFDREDLASFTLVFSPTPGQSSPESIAIHSKVFLRCTQG